MKMLPLCLLLLSLPASAQDKETQAKPWTQTAELGVANTTGNSRVRTITFGEKFLYDWTKVGLELKGAALSSKSQGVSTAEQYDASEKVRGKFHDRLYAFERFGWDRDRFRDIINRFDLSAGLGANVVKTAGQALDTEAGAGFISEQKSVGVRGYAAGRGYAKYAIALSPTAGFSQDAEYLHDFDDPKHYRLNTETAVTAALSKHFSLKVSYKWRRDGRPAPGIGKDDTILSSALIASY